MKKYDEYKDSGIKWIGKIPAEWRIVKFKYFTIGANTGKAISKEHWDDNGSMLLYTAGQQPIKASYANFPSDLLTTDTDILIARNGAGAVQIPKRQSIYTDHVIRFSLNANGIREYLYYVLQLGIEQIVSTVQSVSLKTLSKSSWDVLPIPTPNIPEQRKIVEYINRRTAVIDNLIKEKQKLVELLKEKRNAIISEAVTKGLDKNAPMKDSGIEWIGEIPENWSISRIGFESWVRARLGWKGLKAEEYVDEGCLFLATPNIKNREIDFENVNYITKERYDESPEIKLSTGDVLLAKDGSTLGTVNVIRYLPTEATVNSSIAVITPYKRFDSVYMYYLFQANCITNIIQMKKGGMGVPHLFQADIVKFNIPCPPKSEQKIISSYLDSKTKEIDSLISDITDQIEKLNEYRQATISEAVTGKVAI